jgi:hypothetical protein
MTPTIGTDRLQRFQPTLELLAGRWREAGPLLPGFSLLARGKAASVDEIAAAAGAEVDQVERALDAARCERDARGRLIDLFGLTLSPTLHRLEIGNRILFSCCALWAHVIPKLVDATVQIESVDPIQRQAVRLTVSPERVEFADPPKCVATLAIATQGAINSDVCSAFCCQVRHFISQESAEEFAAALTSCHVVELSELQEAAGLLHERIWRTVDP